MFKKQLEIGIYTFCIQNNSVCGHLSAEMMSFNHSGIKPQS